MSHRKTGITTKSLPPRHFVDIVISKNKCVKYVSAIHYVEITFLQKHFPFEIDFWSQRFEGACNKKDRQQHSSLCL